MYIPKAFREDDIAVLHAFMREYSFATLVTLQDGTPLANHYPFLLDAEHLQKKMQAIVGFEIQITRLEGKFKLSQNRSEGDQTRVATALKESLSPQTAELMSRQRGK
ncbi:MAG: FMN-binding negative transcriptional regulator [Ktedonobacteraceae bacterium]